MNEPNFIDLTRQPSMTEADLRTPEQKRMDDEDSLKILINTFVWQHAPGGMTLDNAEELAVKIWELFLEAREQVHAVGV